MTACSVYFGTYTDKESRGLYRAILDDQGSLHEVDLFAAIENPTFQTFHPALSVLYSVASGQDGSGELLAWRVSRDSFQSELVSRVKTGPVRASHLSIDATGSFVLISSYHEGYVASYDLGADGSINTRLSQELHSGSSIDPERQTSSHVHSAYALKGTSIVLAADLGGDYVAVYKADGGILTKQSQVAVKPGAGPRHLCFSQTNQVVYAINELNSTVCWYSWAEETLVLLGETPTLPEDVENDSNLTAEIALHPSGEFLYGSNRGHDSIVRWRVDPCSGSLSEAMVFDAGGSKPRHFALTASGKHMLVANQASDSIVGFVVDNNGALQTEVGRTKIPSPCCICFGREQ